MDKVIRKSLLVYNPKSGNAALILNNFDLICKKFLKKNITLTLYSINRGYNKLSEIMKNEKYDILILSGGDGTLSRCLSDLYNENIEFPDVAVFPTGTSNDLSSSLNLGNDINEWIENVTEGKLQSVDFGVINGKEIFLSSYAGGLFTKVSYATDKNLKKIMGKTAYHINGLSELANIKEFEFNLTLDTGEKLTEKAILFIIINGKSVGGFDRVTNDASINDGHMNLIIVKSIANPFDIPQILIDLFNNNLVNNDYVIEIVTRKCIIEKIEGEINISIDGEEGENRKVEIEFIKDKLKIFKKV